MNVKAKKGGKGGDAKEEAVGTDIFNVNDDSQTKEQRMA